MRRLLVKCVLPALVLIASAGCRDTAGPAGTGDPADRPTISGSGQTLTIVPLVADAPPLAQQAVTFWAVKGSPAGAVLEFAGEGPGRDYVELRLGPNALAAGPDGAPLAAGDSVQITVRVVDPAQMLFEFLPGGLRFDPAHGAELTVWYAYADLSDGAAGAPGTPGMVPRGWRGWLGRDRERDGKHPEDREWDWRRGGFRHVDGGELEGELGIWHQADPDEGYEPVTVTVRDQNADKLVAVIESFSRYAIAY